jgi:hypothetical protein
MKIIGFAGASGSGKSTAQDYVASFFKGKKINFADALRNVVLEIYPNLTMEDITEGKDTNSNYYHIIPRSILITIGNAARDIYPNTWVDIVKKHVYNPSNKPHLQVIGDVRFQNEADWIHSEGGVVIGIIRPGRETPIIPFADWVLINSGTLEDFHQKIHSSLKGYSI